MKLFNLKIHFDFSVIRACIFVTLSCSCDISVWLNFRRMLKVNVFWKRLHYCLWEHDFTAHTATDAWTSSAPVTSCEDALYIWNISWTPFIIKGVWCYSEKPEEMAKCHGVNLQSSTLISALLVKFVCFFHRPWKMSGETSALLPLSYSFWINRKTYDTSWFIAYSGMVQPWHRLSWAEFFLLVCFLYTCWLTLFCCNTTRS